MVRSSRSALPVDDFRVENPAYLSEQLITYIGNKRSLLAPVAKAVAQVQRELGGGQLRALDAFSGSGIVSRLLKSRSRFIYANDIEDYARVISACFLTNREDVPWDRVDAVLRRMAATNIDAPATGPGFIERLYAPADDASITADDRVFYTRHNARRLDIYRQVLDGYDEQVRTLILGPLLSEASIHANTAGVFKGFYKDRATGVGRFGGTGADALFRIRGAVTAKCPVLSVFSCESRVLQVDANCLPRHVGDLDLAYIDPPYNQHPYGSNYFMLNLLVNYQEPDVVSKVSGIPHDWRRSDYNVRNKAANRLTELVSSLDAKYLLISSNDEGFITPAEMRYMLGYAGTVSEYTVSYNTFRGSRNLRDRNIHLSEHLYLVKKG